MRKPFLAAALFAGVTVACGIAAAQEPGPKLPATPSMDQKDSDDLSKPAGAEKPAPAPPKAAKSEAKTPAAKAPTTKSPPAKPPAAKTSTPKRETLRTQRAPERAAKSHAGEGRRKTRASKRR